MTAVIGFCNTYHVHKKNLPTATNAATKKMITFLSTSCVSLFLTCSAIANIMITHIESAAKGVSIGNMPVS